MGYLGLHLGRSISIGDIINGSHMTKEVKLGPLFLSSIS